MYNLLFFKEDDMTWLLPAGSLCIQIFVNSLLVNPYEPILKYFFYIVVYIEALNKINLIFSFLCGSQQAAKAGSGHLHRKKKMRKQMGQNNLYYWIFDYILQYKLWDVTGLLNCFLNIARFILLKNSVLGCSCFWNAHSWKGRNPTKRILGRRLAPFKKLRSLTPAMV